MMKTFSLISTLLLCLLCGVRAEAGEDREYLTLDEYTPVFAAPDADSSMIAVVRPGGRVELADDRSLLVWWVRHPLARYERFYPVRLEGERIFFLSPDIRCVMRGDRRPKLESNFKVELWRKLLAGAFALLLLAAAAALFSGRYRDGKQRAWLLAAIAALTRQLILMLVVNRFGNVLTCAADENGYFACAMDLCRGSFAGPWSFTIGLPIWYTPFILLSGAEQFYDIAPALDYFSGLVAAPAAMMLGFYIFRKLRIPHKSTFAAMMLWAVWPFVYYYGEDWDHLLFQAFFTLPGGENRWRYYLSLISSGFNSMSDTPSLLVLFAAIAVVAGAPARKRYAALAAAVFGYACLIRINNIFYAPLLCFLAGEKYSGGKGMPDFRSRELWAAAGVAGAVFLAVFSLQLAVNYHQFGNIFTFGYVLHAIDYPGPRPADGFTWQMLFTWRHVKLLAGANYAVWAMGATAMVMLKDEKLRNIFVLWSVPVILFFYGYSHTFCDARRFILGTFMPMFASFAALEGWRELNRKDLCLLCAVFSCAIVWVTPSCYGGELTPFLLPYGSWVTILQFAVPAATAAAALYFFRSGKKRAGATLAVFGGLYFAGNAFVFGAVFLLALTRTLAEIAYAQFVRFRK